MVLDLFQNHVEQAWYLHDLAYVHSRVARRRCQVREAGQRTFQFTREPDASICRGGGFAPLRLMAGINAVQ